MSVGDVDFILIIQELFGFFLSTKESVCLSHDFDLFPLGIQDCLIKSIHSMKTCIWVTFP